MDFVIKDLMISVLPLRPGSDLIGKDCACTCTPCTGGCSPCSDCSKCSTATPGGDWWMQVVNPAPLAALKQQLQLSLAAVEAREREVHEAMKPKSRAEIELLEQHLTEALEELRALKADAENPETTS